jgi:hypothetical protein
MSANQFAKPDLCGFGGLKDRSPMDGTGKLKLSTNGLSADDRGTIIVWVRKD